MDITKHYTTKKQLYIVDRAGFGNKIFDMICGVYLCNRYKGKCTINCVFDRSHHEKHTDPRADEIFAKAKTKINFMPLHEYDELAGQTAFNEVAGCAALAALPSYAKLGPNTRVLGQFSLAFAMYQTFGAADRDLFVVAERWLRAPPLPPGARYAGIHIRYGDKLKMCARATQETFLLYTPQYYADMVGTLRRKAKNPRLPVYIVSDSNAVVAEFIMAKHFRHDPDVHLTSLHWLDAFYLLSHASALVLSSSTFCFAAAYFNRNRPKCYLLADQGGRKFSPEDSALDPGWEVLTGVKYILNYDKPLAVRMSAVDAASRRLAWLARQ